MAMLKFNRNRYPHAFLSHLRQIVALRAEDIARPGRPFGPVDQPRAVAKFGNVLLDLLKQYLHSEFELLLCHKDME